MSDGLYRLMTGQTGLNGVRQIVFAYLDPPSILACALPDRERVKHAQCYVYNEMEKDPDCPIGLIENSSLKSLADAVSFHVPKSLQLETWALWAPHLCQKCGGGFQINTSDKFTQALFPSDPSKLEHEEAPVDVTKLPWFKKGQCMGCLLVNIDTLINWPEQLDFKLSSTLFPCRCVAAYYIHEDGLYLSKDDLRKAPPNVLDRVCAKCFRASDEHDWELNWHEVCSLTDIRLLEKRDRKHKHLLKPTKRRRLCV